MYVVLIYKYEKSIYDLKQKSLLISDTKNMLISNTNVTFKYQCYIFYNKQHAIHMNHSIFDFFNASFHISLLI